MTAAERLAEVADLLALALIRMRARMSSQKSADVGEISLDCNAQRSGPKTTRNRCPRYHCGDRRRRGNQPDLCGSPPTAYAVGTRHRGGDPRWAPTSEPAACRSSKRLSGRMGTAARGDHKPQLMNAQAKSPIRSNQQFDSRLSPNSNASCKSADVSPRIVELDNGTRARH
jgi:hypothetical protein